MPYGYNGRILRVNLASRTMSVDQPPEKFYRTHLGGSALNLYYLLRYMPAGVDPLSPENILALSVGVVTGVPISGQSRMTATARSPLTGCIGDSQSGGFFPAEMKFAGFDAVIIEEKASSPVYLWIHDGEAEIRDASHLWGKHTGEAEDAIKAELGDTKIHVLQIGPAGEKLVRFAALISMCNRANGRTGMGAVMGSKNLKAVAVRGKRKPVVADRKSLTDLARGAAKAFPGSDVAAMGKYGTNVAFADYQGVGNLPSYNFTSGVFDGWEALTGEVMYDTILKGRETGEQERYGRDTCFGCLIRCKRVAEIKEGPFRVDPRYGGPEYETICALGTYCGVDNLAAIAKANENCGKFGMDTISCGATIAWAMETFDAGVLRPEHTGGMDLRFGDAQMVVQLTEMIGRREGFGDVLAEGSAKAAEQLGVGAEFLITSKGQETPAHVPQLRASLGLIYAVNPFGADHESSEHDWCYTPDTFESYRDRFETLGLTKPQEEQSLGAEKVDFARKTQHFYSMLDSLCLCAFVWGPAWQLLGPKELVRMVEAVTGWAVTLEELMTVGERRLNMMRAFNAREGIGRTQDRLPEKFLRVPLRGGASDGFGIDKKHMEAALEEYYRQSGWDPVTGNPTRKTLERLGLDWVTQKLET